MKFIKRFWKKYPHTRKGSNWAKRMRKKEDGFFRFVIVRSPWSRLYSAFFDKTKVCKGTRFQLPYYRKYNKSNFTEFLNGEYKRFKSGKEFDGHHRQISDLFEEDWPDFIGKLENINDDWAIILSRLGIEDAQFPFQNQRGDHYFHSRNSMVGFYKPDQIKMVEEMYEEDIRRFNYRFE